MADGVKLYNEIQALYQGVNTQLLQRPMVKGTVADVLCWVRSNVKGTSVVFPVRFFGNNPKARGPYEQIPATPATLANFAASMRRIAPDAEIIPYDTELADLYGVFQSNASNMLLQAGNEWEYQLAQMIGNGDSATVVIGANGVPSGGATAYDNLPFFNTAKLVNPNDTTKGTFSNVATATDPDKAGLLKAFQHLDGCPGPDGRPLRMPGKIVVVVSNETQYDMAATYLHGTTRGTPAGTASESNVDADTTEGGEGGGVKGRASLIKMPDLNAFRSGKAWGAFKIASAEHRPFTANMVKPPLLYIHGLAPDDLLRALSDNVRTGWWANGGIGYGWSQLAFLGLQS